MNYIGISEVTNDLYHDVIGKLGYEVIDSSPDGKPGTKKSQKVSIDTAHKNAIIHRGSFVVVKNELNQVLFVKRSPQSVTMPSCWSIMGEHTTFGESYKDAALRCVKEETTFINKDSHPAEASSLDNGLPQLWYIQYPDGRADLQWVRFFLVKLVSKNIIVNKAEASDFAWVSVETLDSWRTNHNLCDIEVRVWESTDLFHTNGAIKLLNEEQRHMFPSTFKKYSTRIASFIRESARF